MREIESIKIKIEKLTERVYAEFERHVEAFALRRDNELSNWDYATVFIDSSIICILSDDSCRKISMLIYYNIYIYICIHIYIYIYIYIVQTEVDILRKHWERDTELERKELLIARFNLFFEEAIQLRGVFITYCEFQEHILWTYIMVLYILSHQSQHQNTCVTKIELLQIRSPIVAVNVILVIYKSIENREIFFLAD